MKFYKPGEGRAIILSGTSLQGYVGTTYKKLVDTFGEPTGNDGYKTDAEWDLVFEDDTVATIYNYKDGKNYNGDDGVDVENITDWHIGGHNKLAVERVTELLNTEEVKVMKTILITRSSPMSRENADKLAAMLNEKLCIADVRKFRNTELYYVIAKQAVEIK